MDTFLTYTTQKADVYSKIHTIGYVGLVYIKNGYTLGTKIVVYTHNIYHIHYLIKDITVDSDILHQVQFKQ